MTRPKRLEGAKYLGTLDGRAPATMATLLSGDVVVAQVDAGPVVVGPDGEVKPVKVFGYAPALPCACATVLLEGRSATATIQGVVHRRGGPCYAVGGSKQVGVRPPSPLVAVVESMARLARRAQEDRKAHPQNSWEAGEAFGRFHAYRNAAARLANLAGVADPMEGDPT